MGVGQTGDGVIAADLKRFMARQTFDAAFKLKLGPKVKLLEGGPAGQGAREANSGAALESPRIGFAALI